MSYEETVILYTLLGAASGGAALYLVTRKSDIAAFFATITGIVAASFGIMLLLTIMGR